MPIIQGAVAAGSGAARASGLTQLSAHQRKDVIGRIRGIRERVWSGYPVARGTTLSEMGVELDSTPESDVSPTTIAAEPAPAAEENEPPTPCCCGLISDETATRDAIMEFFEEPASSRGAYMVSLIVFACIVVSTITIILESLPSMDNDQARADFFVVETICIVVFSIEYLVRIVAVKNKCEFIVGPMNLIDLVAILPYYIGILMGAFGLSADDLSLLRLLRLFRIFRIFKLSKYSSGIKICATAIIESKDTLGLMIFMCSVVVIIFASFEYFFESGEWSKERRRFEYGPDHPTPFESIPAAMWWTMVTVMTVGYGDMVPHTEMGKVTAAVAMVCSIVIMALPISVIGANFSRAWMEKKEQDESVSDGRQLAYCFQNLLNSVIKHNSLMEDVLTAGSHSLVALHSDLLKAKMEYARLKPTASGETPEPCDLNGDDHQRLRNLVDSIMQQDRQLQFCLKKVIAVQESSLEQQAGATLRKGKDLENYILRYQEISANIIGLEQVMFGRTLSVSGRG